MKDGRAMDLVVVGAGVSGLTFAYLARSRGARSIAVLEAADRPGGKIRTEWVDRWCCEWGPQGFLDNVPETLTLARDLGLEDELVRADDTAGARFIVRGGRLRRVPTSPPAFLTSKVLSLRGRLRVLLEPFAPRGRGDESVHAFARRRIGVEAADVLVDAMVTGVFAGDPRALSLPATFPKMRAMEHEHGSLTRAMIARRRSGSGGGPAGPGGVLSTFSRGMQQLTDTLAGSLGESLQLSRPVVKVVREKGGFEVVTADGERIRAARVAIAVPPHAAAELVTGTLNPDAVSALFEIPSAPVAVVVTGYRSPRPFTEPTEGFGFLVPGAEGRRILGTIFCSSTFPGQAPPHATLLRTLLGGARRPAMVGESDEQLLATVRRELDSLLGGDPEPDFAYVVRHTEAIAQYTLGHLERVRRAREAAEAVPGLVLLGQGYGGIAVNACVSEAFRLA